MTTESHDNPGAAPVALGSTDGLGPLPEPDVSWVDGKDKWGYDDYSHAYSADAMRAYAAAAVAAERGRCAKWVEARRDAFCEKHGSIDPDTGALEFGRGAHAEAKSEYVGELEEIAAGLRALPGA